MVTQGERTPNNQVCIASSPMTDEPLRTTELLKLLMRSKIVGG